MQDKPVRFTIRQHRPGSCGGIDIHTRPTTFEKVERMAQRYADTLGIRVEVIQSRTGAIVATFGA